jgi:hypothetical protein
MPNQELALTANEIRSLRCLAGMMIPASTAHGVPGADDDTIFADIVDNLGRDAASVKQGLQHLDALAGGVFADRDPAQRQAAAAALQDAGGTPLNGANQRYRAMLLPRPPCDALPGHRGQTAVSKGV